MAFGNTIWHIEPGSPHRPHLPGIYGIGFRKSDETAPLTCASSFVVCGLWIDVLRFVLQLVNSSGEVPRATLDMSQTGRARDRQVSSWRNPTARVEPACCPSFCAFVRLQRHVVCLLSSAMSFVCAIPQKGLQPAAQTPLLSCCVGPSSGNARFAYRGSRLHGRVGNRVILRDTKSAKENPRKKKRSKKSQKRTRTKSPDQMPPMYCSRPRAAPRNRARTPPKSV